MERFLHVLRWAFDCIIAVSNGRMLSCSQTFQVLIINKLVGYLECRYIKLRCMDSPFNDIKFLDSPQVFGVTKGNECLQNLASEKNGRKHLICSCILHFALGVGDMAQLVDPCTCNWVAVIMVGCIIFQGFGPEDSCQSQKAFLIFGGIGAAVEC